MRDNRLNKELIEKKLNKEIESVKGNFERIKRFKEDIEKGLHEDGLDEWKKLDLIYVNYEAVIEDKVKIIHHKYTLGFSMEDLHKEYLVIPEQFDKIDGDCTFYYSEVFALGILFEESIDKFKKLINLMDSCMEHDLLSDYLINGCGFRRQYYSSAFRESELEFSKELIELAQKDKKAASKKLAYHLKQEWTFSELPEDCTGWWLWEYAAIVKMFGLDDSEIKDHPHYPYELAHYKNEMKFFPEKMLDFPPEKKYKKGIPEYPRLEKLIPVQFHEMTNNLFIDFKNMDDEDFYDEYGIYDAFSMELDEFIEKKDELFGQILIGMLTGNYILAFHNLDDLEDIYLYKNFWGKRKVRPVCFDIYGDTYYIAYVPKSMKLKSIFGIKIIDVKEFEELDQYSEYIGQFDDE